MGFVTSIGPAISSKGSSGLALTDMLRPHFIVVNDAAQRVMILTELVKRKSVGAAERSPAAASINVACDFCEAALYGLHSLTPHSV